VFMTYKEQLDHPKWQMRRLKILKRDKATCQECGCKEKQLHVHHKRYVSGRMAWDYQDWELTSLCKDCQAAKHSKPKDEPVKPKERTAQEIRDIIRDWEGELRGAELREKYDRHGEKPMTPEKARAMWAGIRAQLG